MEMLEKISGIIESVVFRNEENDYCVIEIIDSDNLLVTAVGIIPFASEGESVTLTGSWTYHKDFGRQFSFSAFEKKLPEGVDGILQYLSSRTIKGVGPVTALKIVNKFGEASFDVIENHPEWLAGISGITMKKAAEISEAFREQSGMRTLMMFCKDYMGSAEIAKVYKAFGTDAVEMIEDNPYLLCENDFGISFEKADALAKSLCIEPDNESRVLSGIKYVLSTNASNNGHTALPFDKLAVAATSLLEIGKNDIEAMLREFINKGTLDSLKTDGAEYVMTKEVSDAEAYVAKKLKALNDGIEFLSKENALMLIENAELSFGIEYAPLQRQAIYEAISSGVMILTGGPGTGKTTVIKALLNIFKSQGLSVVLSAPTGRAAKRMSDATSEEAKTVHRMLEMERSETEKLKFGRDRRNPLDEDVVIVDESSMIDLSLFKALLSAMKRGSRLILIGDADQLPSVGAGNVFSDLIESKAFKTVRLNEIFRQSKESLIVTNAHKINTGEAPILTAVDKDFFFVRRDNERDIPEAIASLITERLPKTYGKSIASEIQVITPSKKGVGGVDTLNAKLQAKINPPAKLKKEKLAHGTFFRVGDRVMQITNNYELEWERQGRCGLGIFNGDIGVIEEINLQDEEMKILFEDRLATYPFELLDELELAYSITVHKSQGSEYPVVIIPMYSCTPMLLTRNLFYTAVTRARRMVILVGRCDIPEKMVKNNREIKRYTTLKARILRNA